MRQRIASHASSAFAGFRKLTLAGAASTIADQEKLSQRLRRFADAAAPLIEIRDDDLQANGVTQRDCTLWSDAADAVWTAQLQRRFADPQVRPAPDALAVHAITRALHYPGYVLGQIEYYRAHYESMTEVDGANVSDLMPADLLVGAALRDAYERVVLACAVGVVAAGADGHLSMNDASLGDSLLSAARLLHAPESEAVREQLETALAPRLEIARNVRRDLQALRESAPLTALDRNVLDGLLRKY